MLEVRSSTQGALGSATLVLNASQAAVLNITVGETPPAGTAPSTNPTTASSAPSTPPPAVPDEPEQEEPAPPRTRR